MFFAKARSTQLLLFCTAGNPGRSRLPAHFRPRMLPMLGFMYVRLGEYEQDPP